MKKYIYSMKKIYQVTEYQLDQDEIRYYPTISKKFKKKEDAKEYIEEMNKLQDLPFE